MMDWTSVIKTVAPWIGTALGGPLGGMAVEAASNALGLSTKTTDSLKQALSGATPEQMLALKQADDNFAVQMQKLGFDHLEKMDELSFKDTDSARNREIQTHDVTPKVIAAVIISGFFALNVVLLYVPVPKDSASTIFQMVGTLSAAFGIVIGYYFGSSKSSDRKTELLAQAPAVEKS
jgi:hypothetical protein